MRRVTEELLLLILDAETGGIQYSLSKHQRDLVIAGAVLTDLTLENRIDTDPERLFLIDSKPLNDELLDPTLLDIANETATHDTAYWIDRTAKRSGIIREKALNRLISDGILVADANGLVFPSRLAARAQMYPTVDGKTTKHVQARVLTTLFSDEIPSPRDIIIIGLAAACGVFESILSREELAEVRERIDSITRLDLIGRVISEGVRTSKPAVLPPKVVRPAEAIPEVAGLPLVGSAFQMAGDIVDFLESCYHEYGPIFQVRAFGFRFIALVGPEANVFMTKIAGTHLRSYEPWKDFTFALGGMHRALLSMDGPDHFRMRKLLARGYSPRSFTINLDVAHDLTLRLIDKWPQDRSIGIQRAMQDIIAEQIGVCLTGISPKKHIDHLIYFLGTTISIHVSKRYPKFMERTPKYRRARSSVRELADEILEAHQPGNRTDGEPDFVDDLLEMNRRDPQFLPETDLRGNVIAPFLVGIDTSASACAYMLHTVLQHPELLTRMRAEVDAVFERGQVTIQGLRKLDVTHRVALETLRQFPIIPVLPRTVSNSFEFAGYKVPAGAQVMLGTTVSHRLDECFPDAERFDIERHTRQAIRRRRRGAFVPFGLGPHRCLGSGFAELQIALTLATIIRETELALDHPRRPVKTKVTPSPHPHPSVRFRLVRRRRP